MSLTVATTSIAIRRTQHGSETDYWDTDDDSVVTVARGIPAHISSPGGIEQTGGGSQESVTFRLDCEICDLVHTDQVLDETTGDVYEVLWAVTRRGLGLDHMEAGLSKVQGAA